MQPLTPKRFVLLSLFPLLMLSACGGEAEPAEPVAGPLSAGSHDALRAIPREELYGASPVDNLWSPRAELEVLDLPTGWNGARVAILSDLQLGLWEQNAEVAAAAVQRAIEEEPDLIVLLGDFLAPGGDPSALERVLMPLRGRAAFAVLGDRDIRSDSVAALVTATLERNGVRLLRNTSAPAIIGGDTAWVAGLDPELVQMSVADQQWVLLNVGPPGRTPLLLTHHPVLAARGPIGRYPVALAGSTFCGEVEVPGTPRLASLRENIFPGATVEGVERLFQIAETTLMVTCGTGYGFVPLRFGAAPEVPILTLLGFGAAEPLSQGEVVEDSLVQRFQQPSGDSL